MASPRLAAPPWHPSYVRPDSYAAPAAAVSARVNRLVYLGLYLFLASIPFESPVRILPFDVPTVIGALFLATTLLEPRLVWGRVPGPVWFFLAYIYVYGLSFVVNGGQYPAEVKKQFIPLFQLLLIFWASCNLMRKQEIAERALLVFIAACVGLAILQLTGIANADVDFGGGITRARVLGQNPNRTARILSVGVLGVVGLAFLRAPALLRPRPLSLGIGALLGIAMIEGGSRGALLSLAAGVFTFAVGGRSLANKLRNLGLTTLLLAAGAVAALQSPLMRARLELAESGNLAKREEIFPTALQMFAEKPWWGWGPQVNQYELGSRLPEHAALTRDMHNMILELLTAVGLFGAPLFLAGLAACTVCAWRARHGPHGGMALAMMGALAVGNMSGNFIVFKPYWLVLALAAAAGSMIPRPEATRHPNVD